MVPPGRPTVPPPGEESMVPDCWGVCDAAVGELFHSFPHPFCLEFLPQEVFACVE